jgi:hypothetical protein
VGEIQYKNLAKKGIENNTTKKHEAPGVSYYTSKDDNSR